MPLLFVQSRHTPAFKLCVHGGEESNIKLKFNTTILNKLNINLFESIVSCYCRKQSEMLTSNMYFFFHK